MNACVMHQNCVFLNFVAISCIIVILNAVKSLYLIFNI